MARILCENIESVDELRKTVKKMGYEPFKDERDLKNFFKKCGYEPAHDLDYEMKNAEWLKIKHGVIGGSEAGIVHGVSPFVSRAKLAADKIADFELESGIDAAKQYIFDLGHQFEPVALSYYQRVTGNETFTSRCMYQHDKKDFMIADLDGLCITSEGELRICEIKFTNPRASKEWKSGVHGKDGYCAVSTYFAQCQHVMAVLGNNIKELFPDMPIVNDRIEAVDMIVGCSNMASDVKIVTVKRDDKYIANLEKEEEDFWNCVKNCVIPDSCLKQDELSKIKDKFDVMPSAAIDNLILSLDKEHIEKIVNLESRKQEISSRMKNEVKKIDEAIDTLKLPLFADFLNRNINNGEVIEEGFRIAIETKISETVDYSALKKENPEFYKKYLKKPKVSQKITVDAL